MKNFKLALIAKALAYSALMMPAYSVSANNELDNYRKILEDPNVDENLIVASIKNYMLVVKDSEVIREDDIRYIQGAFYKYRSQFDVDDQLLFLNADLYMMQGNNEKALEYTIQVLENATSSTMYDAAFVSAMRLAYITSEWEQASELYTRYVHQAGLNGRYYGTLLLSGSLSSLERHSEAVDYATEVYLNYFDTTSQNASEVNLLSVVRSAYLAQKSVLFDNRKLNEIEPSFVEQWLNSYVVEKRDDIRSELLWHFGEHLNKPTEEQKINYAMESIDIDLSLSMYQMAVLKSYYLAQRDYDVSISQIQQEWLNKNGLYLSDLALSLDMENRAYRALVIAMSINSPNIINSSKYHEVLGDIYLEMGAYEEAQAYYLAAISIVESKDTDFAVNLYKKRITALRRSENNLLLIPVIKRYLTSSFGRGELIEEEEFNYMRNLFVVYLNQSHSSQDIDELLFTIYQGGPDLNEQELEFFDMAIAHAENFNNGSSAQEYVYGAMSKANDSSQSRYIEKFIQTSMEYFNDGPNYDRLVAFEQVYQITGDETVLSNYASSLIEANNFTQLEAVFERYPEISVLGLNDATHRYAYLYRSYRESGDHENEQRTLRWLADNAYPMEEQIAYHKVLLSEVQDQSTQAFYEEAEAYLAKLSQFDDFDKRLLAANVKTDYFIKAQDSAVSRLVPMSVAENGSIYSDILALYRHSSDDFGKERIQEIGDLRNYIGLAQAQIKQLNEWYQRLGSDQDYRWLVDYHRVYTNVIVAQTLYEFSEQLEGRASEQVVGLAKRFIQQSRSVQNQINLDELLNLSQDYPGSRYEELQRSFEDLNKVVDENEELL